MSEWRCGHINPHHSTVDRYRQCRLAAGHVTGDGRPGPHVDEVGRVWVDACEREAVVAVTAAETEFARGYDQAVDEIRSWLRDPKVRIPGDRCLIENLIYKTWAKK